MNTSRQAAEAVTTDLYSGDEMSPSERAYFESRGTTPLEVEGGDQPEQKTQPTPPTYGDPDDGSDEIETEDIEYDDQGNARSKETGRFVPKSAYLRVKSEKTETEKRLSQIATQLIRERERAAVFQEIAGKSRQEPDAPVAQEEVEPDPSEDIFAFVAYQKKQIEALRRQIGQVDQTFRQNHEAVQIKDAALADLQTFVSREPQFMAAYEHLMRQRHSELEALGYSDETQRDELIRQEAKSIVESAIKNRRSAGETLFKLAKARGFTGAPAEPPKIDTSNIDRINAGQKAAASLRSAGGAAGTGEALTAQTLAQMDDDSYGQARKAYISKHGRSAWNKLIGG